MFYVEALALDWPHNSTMTPTLPPSHDHSCTTIISRFIVVAVLSVAKTAADDASSSTEFSPLRNTAQTFR